MTERPIIFSGPTVRAILADKKTQTRRVIKPHRGWEDKHTVCKVGMPHAADPWVAWWHYPETDRVGHQVECPYGNPGDKLWVREAWGLGGDLLVDPCLNYKAGGQRPINRHKTDQSLWYPHGSTTPITSAELMAIPMRTTGWRHAMFMPRWASRLTLEITDVRAERLQEISEEDAKAEGVEPEPTTQEDIDNLQISDAPPQVKELARLMGPGQFPARFEFEMLWDSINGKSHPWDSNPFVWVISFRRIE